MSIFKRKSQGTLVPIHPDNAKTKDWVVLLEAAAIHADLLDRRDMDEDVLAATAVRLGIKP
jgi:tRNA(Met) C34 N-acetyltransferase TmcA